MSGAAPAATAIFRFGIRADSTGSRACAASALDVAAAGVGRTTAGVCFATGESDSVREGVAAIGSGGSYALAAARALMNNTDLPPRKVAEESMKIAGQICIFTNDKVNYEEL